MTKLFLSLLFVFGLSACGGGSESNSDSSSSASSNNVSSYVKGEFKNSLETGMYAPIHDLAYGNEGYDCSVNNDYYFESDNAVIFGIRSFSDDDFKYAATLVEQQLPAALDAFNITQAEFTQARPYFITRIADDIIDYMAEGWEFEINNQYYFNDITDLELISTFEAPDDWDSMVYWERYKHVAAYWNSLSKEAQVELKEEYIKAYAKENPNYDHHPIKYYGEVFVPKKVMVCLTERMGSIVYGEGTLLGMNLPPKSYATREYGDESQVVLHELIHTIQHNISSPVRMIGRTMDHWFKEGQATFLAGQTTANSTDEFSPVDVVTWSDETSVFASTGDAYKHYALAYSYIDKNNSANQIKEMLYSIRNFKGEGEISPSNHVSGSAFESAFNANITKKGGKTLTLHEFRSDYQSLMSQ